MSTYLYLACLDHEPPLMATSESGQHTYDLPQIREDIANREAVVAAHALDIWPQGDRFRCSTMRFLAKHPKCRLGIRDEYGGWYYTYGDSMKPYIKEPRG